MNDTQNQKSKHPVVRTLVGTGLLVVIGLVILLYGYRVIDAVLASRFVPTSDVASVIDNIQLTQEGSNLLKASEPAIQTSQQFNQSCESAERTRAILGCYYARKIYIYDVTNAELDGAEEVTAAHEMLHAAYERLHIFERPYVDRILNEQYQKVKTDADIKGLIDYYETAEPGSVNNELHSILGTIKTELSPELEKYYARYFTDRQAIVGLNTRYNAVFDDVERRSKVLSERINAMKPRVEADLSAYRQDLQQLDADVALFNQQATAGVFKTTAAFNAARQSLVNRASALNARRSSVNNAIAQYNAVIAEQQKLSVRVEQLNSSINAVPAAGGV